MHLKEQLLDRAKELNLSVNSKTGELDGVFYSMLWESGNGDIGFIATLEQMSHSKSGARSRAAGLRAILETTFRLKFTNRLIRLKLPDHRALYPMWLVRNRDEEIPFAAISGPWYDREMKLKREMEEKSESA